MNRSQAEILLQLAINTDAEGTDLAAETRRVMGAHAQRLLEEEQMLLKALQINRQGQDRFANYMPQKPVTLRQAIQQGPTNPQIPAPQRKENGQTQEQR